MAVEHYNRLARLVEHGAEVELELDVRCRFSDDDPMGYNTVAEIPGSDRRGEVVMAGAHLDSWHGGSGATDNGAGVSVAMEAVRILKALDVRPRRTIRIGLWSGEEEGELGSRAYVAEHLASRPRTTEESRPEDVLKKEAGRLILKPDHAKLSAYFNLDAGTGRIRGIHSQGNAAVVPIFEAWLRPLADLGATTVTQRDDDGTDHESFDAVGLPAFNFIQDEVEYETRTHHSNMDVVDHVQRGDLMQASVVMAAFLYDAAMRDERLPRKPLPLEAPETEE
jgi:Zn-dependent M28 family amino/carboxypeptidase